jgi:predicted DCC family thiol-disulfide oxidoreductase YuxK
MKDGNAKPIVLYDGVCGLCNRLTRFLLKHDHNDRLRFAPLQSDFASSILRKHNVSASDLDSVYVVTDLGQPNEQVLARSDAILHLFSEIGGVWRAGELAKIIPRVVRDWVYNLVGRNRYRVFGKYDVCPVPDERDKEKFLA